MTRSIRSRLAPALAGALALSLGLDVAACSGGVRVTPAAVPDRTDGRGATDSTLDARVDSAAERVADSLVTGAPDSAVGDTIRLPSRDTTPRR